MWKLEVGFTLVQWKIIFIQRAGSEERLTVGGWEAGLVYGSKRKHSCHRVTAKRGAAPPFFEHNQRNNNNPSDRKQIALLNPQPHFSYLTSRLVQKLQQRGYSAMNLAAVVDYAFRQQAIAGRFRLQEAVGQENPEGVYPTQKALQ